MGEITAMLERLTATAAHRTGRMLVLPLHSSVSPQEQRRIFDRPPPGARKVGALGRAGGAHARFSFAWRGVVGRAGLPGALRAWRRQIERIQVRVCRY
jgi:hypothetical protein